MDLSHLETTDIEYFLHLFYIFRLIFPCLVKLSEYWLELSVEVEMLSDKQLCYHQNYLSNLNLVLKGQYCAKD